MREHERCCKQMPTSERDGVENRAQLGRASSMDTIQKDIHHSQALVSSGETRAREEELQLGKLMLVSNCRFSADTIEQLQMFVDSAPLSRADVQRWCKEAVAGP